MSYAILTWFLVFYGNSQPRWDSFHSPVLYTMESRCIEESTRINKALINHAHTVCDRNCTGTNKACRDAHIEYLKKQRTPSE